ncbi:MAG: NAD-binding protein [Burkholderiales bacterium]|nr:NAD-binding protein [Burkholderiales bacterium]
MTTPIIIERLRRRFAKPLAVLVGIHVVGTVGYKIIGGPQDPRLDALYMTFITVATIGYAEVISLDDDPVGRLFTMVIGFAGIATTWYIFSTMTAFIVEGEINVPLRRRRMLKAIEKLSGHYIVCGIGRVGTNVAQELTLTGRRHVIVDVAQAKIDAFRDRYSDTLWLHGDAAEDQVLADAGVARAAGVFAITGDDAKNLVITLSVKQLNPDARVVARCHDVSYTEKMRRVGADAIVSPDFTGGMRIASSMLRPKVVSFLDEMLRSEEALRVEELVVPAQLAGSSCGALGARGADYLLLAIRSAGKWRFNPPDDQTLVAGDTLVFMTTPEGRRRIEARLS